MEEKQLLSEPLPDDPASQPISQGELGHPTEKTHFGRCGCGGEMLVGLDM